MRRAFEPCSVLVGDQVLDCDPALPLSWIEELLGACRAHRLGLISHGRLLDAMFCLARAALGPRSYDAFYRRAVALDPRDAAAYVIDVVTAIGQTASRQLPADIEGP